MSDLSLCDRLFHARQKLAGRGELNDAEAIMEAERALTDLIEDAEWLREQAENLVRYEEDAQRLRRMAGRLSALSEHKSGANQ